MHTLKEVEFIMQTQPSTYTGTGHITQTDRLYYLDWLRLCAILVVFLHHCSKLFDYHTTSGL
jgi:peptidoglycan/LPS O-acetylase OafA/YrhL